MNDYLAKQNVCTGAAYIGGSHLSSQSNATMPTASRSVLEGANDQLQSMIAQLDMIDSVVAQFLSRTGIEIPAPNAEAQRPPQSSLSLPKLQDNLNAFNRLLNSLGEHVSKLNQIA